MKMNKPSVIEDFINPDVLKNEHSVVENREKFIRYMPDELQEKKDRLLELISQEDYANEIIASFKAAIEQGGNGLNTGISFQYVVDSIELNSLNEMPMKEQKLEISKLKGELKRGGRNENMMLYGVSYDSEGIIAFYTPEGDYEDYRSMRPNERRQGVIKSIAN